MAAQETSEGALLARAHIAEARLADLERGAEPAVGALQSILTLTPVDGRYAARVRAIAFHALREGGWTNDAGEVICSHCKGSGKDPDS